MLLFWSVVLHVALSFGAFAVGSYVFLEKKMYIGGYLSSGKVYDFVYPANVVLALSLYSLGMFFLLTLISGDKIKKICEWLFIAFLALFFISGLI
jgi:hypothetical protein